jgi:hypothetical protein
MFGWLKYLLLRQVNSIKHKAAATYKYRLSVAYALASWTLFSFIVYSIAKDKAPKLNDGNVSGIL